jgi:hypothetical protein
MSALPISAQYAPAGPNRPQGAYRGSRGFAYPEPPSRRTIDSVKLFGTAADRHGTTATDRRTLILLSLLEPPQTAAGAHSNRPGCLSEAPKSGGRQTTVMTAS